VVRLAIPIWRRARGIQRSLPRDLILLAGIAVLPTQSGSISLLAPGRQLRAIEGLSTGSAVQATPYGDFLSPAGSLNPAWSFGFGWTALGLPEMQGSDPTVTAFLNAAVSPAGAEFGVGAGPAPDNRAGAPAGIQMVCAGLPWQLQAGGEFWSTQAVSVTPVQLPWGQFASNPLGDPTQGPSGHPSNVSAPGPAGAWCRPPSVPFAQSSPLMSRTFWTPIGIVLLGIVVLWLSRGVKLPP
jgi:hypothetical protein